jgi:hypothetical protein
MRRPVVEALNWIDSHTLRTEDVQGVRPVGSHHVDHEVARCHSGKPDQRSGPPQRLEVEAGVFVHHAGEASRDAERCTGHF